MVKYKYDAETEWNDSILSTLKEKISTYARLGGGVDCVYIGKAGGGSDWEGALKNEYDDFKQMHDLNHMVCIYETTNEVETLNIVRQLTEYYQGAPSFLEDPNPLWENDAKRSREPIHYVFLAYRKRWESDDEDDDDDVFM